MVKVLITGGAGFIGYHLARSHLNNGDTVVILDDCSKLGGELDGSLQKLTANARYFLKTVDLTQEIPAIPEIDHIDVVYHLAAINGTRLFYEVPYKVANANLRMTLNLLEWLQKRSVKRLVYASTSEVYAGCDELGLLKIPTGEDVPVVFPQPTKVRFSYATSKFMGEFLCLQFGREQNIPTTVVRYHNIYGPRMGTKHVIPEFILRCQEKGSTFRIHGADETRAFCFVDDAVEATRLIAMASTSAFEVVHIGNSKEEITIRELAKIIMGLLGEQRDLEEREGLIGSVSRRCPDTSKLKRLTGYEARVNLRDGLSRTIPWYVSAWSQPAVFTKKE